MKSIKLFNSLQFRILLVILFFLSVPVVILLQVNFSHAEKLLEEKASGLILGNLEQIGTKIDNVTQDIMKISSIVSTNSVIESKLSEKMYRDLSSFDTKELQDLDIKDIEKVSDVQKQINYVKSNFFNYNINVILLGADGNIYSSLDTVKDEFDFKNKFIKKYKSQNWFNILKTGKEIGVWTAPYSYDIDGFGSDKRYISLARVMKDIYTQNIQGIIMVNFSEDNFMKNLGSDVNGAIALLNSDKQVIFSSNSEKVDSQISFEEAYNKIPDQGKGNFTTKVNGTKYLFNYYSIDRSGWTLVSVIPYSEVTKEITALKKQTYTINFLSYGIFLIIAIFLLVYITNPLKKLIRRIRIMKIGEYSIGSKNMEFSDDVSGIVNSFEYMFKRVEELVQIVIMEQKRESDMKYEALRAQINPHFLFNTLNTIKWSAIMSGSENVSKMISALGKLLEVSMNKGEDEITLREEMELTESYVYIQNIKNNDKLKLFFDIDEKLQELKILKLILQPIVENSINHGLKNKPGSGEIIISALINNNKLVVTVRDDGVGISKEKVEGILYADDDNGRHKYNGIGLNNIHERLKIKYGSYYGLSIESEEGKGTKVDIILPVIKNTALGGGYLD